MARSVVRALNQHFAGEYVCEKALTGLRERDAFLCAYLADLVGQLAAEFSPDYRKLHLPAKPAAGKKKKARQLA